MSIFDKIRLKQNLQIRSTLFAILVLSFIGVCFFLVTYSFLGYERQAIHYHVSQQNHAQIFSLLHQFEKSYIHQQRNDTIIQISNRIEQYFDLLENGGLLLEGQKTSTVPPDQLYTPLLLDVHSVWRNLRATMESQSDTVVGMQQVFYDNIVQDAEKLLLLNQSLVESYKQSYLDKSKEWYFYIVLFLSLIAIMVIFIYYNIFLALINPVQKIIQELRELSEGKTIHTKNIVNIKDEVGMLKKNTYAVSERLKELSDFALEVGKGNFEIDLRLASTEDMLGKALLDMKNNLKIAADNDRIRNWTNENLAFFADLLRQKYEDSTDFSYQVIANLVKLLQANQGGIFILDAENQNLHLEASYAYARRKFHEKIISMESGLLGQAILEKRSLHLTEIPQNYTHITSGLGESTPTSLLIVPMIDHEVVYGVIEMASFKKFTDYQINFIEKISQTIASTLADKKSTEKMQILIEEGELYKEQTKAQEEEMQQGMEELAAIQEEMERVQKELSLKEQNLHNLIDSSKEYILAIDRNFKIIVSNEAAKLFFYSKADAGESIFRLIREDEEAFWRESLHKVMLGQNIWFVSNYKNPQTQGDYEDIYFEHHLNPLKKDHQIIGVAIFSRNISHLTPIRWYSTEGQGTDAAF